MRKILKLVCVSVLGGALTLTAYKHFFEDVSVNQTIENKSNATLFPVNYTTTSNGGTNVDFTTIAGGDTAIRNPKAKIILDGSPYIKHGTTFRGHRTR